MQKKSLHALEQERPRCSAKEEKLERTNIGERCRAPGFLDESGANMDITRHYVRAEK